MVATLDGIPFDVDPHSVKWDYRVHVSDKPYLGGKVVQVHGATVTDITIRGKYGRGDLLTRQLAFLRRMKDMGNVRLDNLKAQPSRFTWPEQRWDMSVILLSVGKLVHDPAEIAPDWEIVLFPVTGSDELKSASMASFIERLTAGMGWRPGAFNGGSPQQVQEALAATGSTTLQQYLTRAFGLGATPVSGTPTLPSTGTPTSAPGGSSVALTSEQLVRLAYNANFRGPAVAIAAAIAMGESSGIPNRTNKVAPDYSIGLWQINMLAHAERYGTEAELMVPERNAAAAYQIYVGRGSTFAAWSVFTNNAYLRYLPQMEAAANSLGLS